MTHSSRRSSSASSNGLIYALVALGYTLVYGIIELINFAHGDVFMLGSMLALTIFLQLGLTHQTPFLTALLMIIGVLLFVMTATALLNVSIERFAYRPLRNAPKVAPLISAIGVSFVLQNVGLIWKGPAVQGFENVIPNENVLTTLFGLTTSHRDHLQAAVRRRGDDPAPRRPDLVRQEHPAGQGHAGDRPGSERGRA